MSGILYLCATPIGNLEDITLRVLRILKESDLIAAEDTRNTIKLLNHFNIKTPMTSYHEHNKTSKAVYLVGRLLDGINIALVTDAGTPGISDPGEEIVKKHMKLEYKLHPFQVHVHVLLHLHYQDYQQDVLHLKHFFLQIKKNVRQ